MFSIESQGTWQKTETWLQAMQRLNLIKILEASGKAGVAALASATPIDSGLSSSSWGYEVSGGRGQAQIIWTNSDVENGFPVAIMLQYGYGTGTGGYVQGRDYINPAMKPIFDQIATNVWKAVTSV